MQACESASSSWKFSGGFRTWVKMSLVETKEEDGREAVEFRQEVGGAGRVRLLVVQPQWVGSSPGRGLCAGSEAESGPCRSSRVL